ncbi:MAG: 3-dehydroquinate synthase [Candidatus Cloacimonetes bacterium]|nr:3-dehydroquinate synthase [Candidatus Cloacimonadota bacterium]
MRYSLGSFQTELLETELNELIRFLPDNSYWVIDKKLTELSTVFNSQVPEAFLVNATEENKNLNTAAEMFYWLQKSGANRGSTIIAAGGGITTDIAGWVSSNYMRGCHLINIPTTIIGMIDASLGGKTGINFNQAKNIIGSFYPAEKVILSYELLDTLSEKEIRSGMAELLKMALLPGDQILQKLINLERNWLLEREFLIRSAGEKKLNICRNDLHDQGERRILNLGHTFAHVIESASDFRIEHGRAVAIGLYKAAELSYQLKLISSKRKSFICKLLKLHFPVSYLQIDENTRTKIENTGEKFYQQDKKSRLVLYSGENEIVIINQVKWNKFKNILLEDIA